MSAKIPLDEYDFEEAANYLAEVEKLAKDRIDACKTAINQLKNQIEAEEAAVQEVKDEIREYALLWVETKKGKTGEISTHISVKKQPEKWIYDDIVALAYMRNNKLDAYLRVKYELNKVELNKNLELEAQIRVGIGAKRSEQEYSLVIAPLGDLLMGIPDDIEPGIG